MSSFEYDYINFTDTVDDDWLSNEFSDDIYGLLCSSNDGATDVSSEVSSKITDETSSTISDSNSNKKNYVKTFRKYNSHKGI